MTVISAQVSALARGDFIYIRHMQATVAARVIHLHRMAQKLTDVTCVPAGSRRPVTLHVAEHDTVAIEWPAPGHGRQGAPKRLHIREAVPDITASAKSAGPWLAGVLRATLGALHQFGWTAITGDPPSQEPGHLAPDPGSYPY